MIFLHKQNNWVILPVACCYLQHLTALLWQVILVSSQQPLTVRKFPSFCGTHLPEYTVSHSISKHVQKRLRHFIGSTGIFESCNSSNKCSNVAGRQEIWVRQVELICEKTPNPEQCYVRAALCLHNVQQVCQRYAPWRSTEASPRRSLLQSLTRSDSSPGGCDCICCSKRGRTFSAPIVKKKLTTAQQHCVEVLCTALHQTWTQNMSRTRCDSFPAHSKVCVTPPIST
jgi:hypothetical protein